MAQETFRIFYNQHIFPELLRLENRRKRLLRLLAGSLFAILVLGGFLVYLDLFVLALFMTLPIAFYMSYLGYRINQFRLTFKPRVMTLILDFIDEAPNIGTLSFDAQRKIEREAFQASRIFATAAPYYRGEDFISGKVGHTVFSLCELRVEENNPVKPGRRDVFRGVFLRATFPDFAKGNIQVWPRHQRQHLMKAIKAFNRKGGDNVDHEIMNPEFRELFITYATEDTPVARTLTEPMQSEIVNYWKLTGKDMYFSFQDREIYLAVTEPKDLMEPYIFRSNLSFELVREFSADVLLLLHIVGEFDRTH
jgi:hypothetical protein